MMMMLMMMMMMLCCRVPRFSVHSDYEDSHLYIFSKFVIELLEEDPDITSIKDHLVPKLVRLQWKPEEELLKKTVTEATLWEGGSLSL